MRSLVLISSENTLHIRSNFGLFKVFLLSKMNCSYNSSLPISSEDIVFATLYSLIVFFGVLGNGIVISIVRNTPSMYTPTNYLLLNLAVGDLIALLFCPGFYEFALKNVYLGARVGDVMCKLFFGNATVCVSWDASILTLCVIALERFIGIVKPFNNDWALTKKRVSLVVIIIWVMAVTSSFPDILWTKYINNRSRLHFCSPCDRPWTVFNPSFLVKAYTVTHSVVLIVFPSAIILFCYISVFSELKRGPGDSLPDKMNRKKTQKLLKLLVSLAVAFCVLCLPFALFFFYVLAQDVRKAKSETCLLLALRIVRFLAFSNSFVNPLLYAAQSSNYRLALKKYLCCRNNANAGRDLSLRMANRSRKYKRDQVVKEEEGV